MTISFTGLANGVDYGSIVAKLVEAEKSPNVALNTRKTNTQKRLTTLGDVITKLKTLQSKAKGLDLTSEVRAVTTTSGDATKIRVSSSGAATPRDYAIQVTQLATAETSRSTGFATKDAGVAGTGTLDITVGGAAAVTVSYDATDSLDAIATKINASGARVQASVIHDGTTWRVFVAGSDTGAANAITFSETGAGLGLADPSAEVMTAKDAIFTVDGAQITRASNTVNDVAAGLTLELLSTTAAPVAVKVANDVAGQRAKVQGLVDAYNDVAKVLNAQLTYTGTRRGEETLFADPTIMGLQRRLADVFSRTYTHGTGTTSTGRLGITLGRDRTLTLDAAKFDAAMAKDPAAIESLLAGSTDALAGTLSTLVDSYAAATTGVLPAKEASLRKTVTRLDDQMAQIELNATKMGARLSKQFTALEQKLTAYQDQASYLSALYYQGV